MVHKINVTKEDIAEGCRGFGGSCMVALAAARALGVQVYASYRGDEGQNPFLRIGIKGQMQEIPAFVGEKMHAYDENKEVFPFEFEVDIP